MLTIGDLPLNATVSFDLHADHVLGTGVTRAKVLAYLDAETAGIFLDVPAVWANVYPSLPAGTASDFRAYPFLKLRLGNGETTVVSLAWIRDETLRIETTRRMQLVIDNVSPADQNAILEALAANGFSAVAVSFPEG